jgi:hypothetical protein
LPRGVLIAGILGACLLMLYQLAGLPQAAIAAAMTAVSEGGMALLIVVSAGGYGWLILRRLSPSASTGLAVVTAAALGLCLLSIAVLAVGSLGHGLLRSWLWWPVVGAGVLLAAWQGRARLDHWRLPTHFDGRVLIWVLVAIFLGIALAGATLPAGFGPVDDYDVLEYHLQLPREYYHNQHIAPLDHNVYSHYPLGVEMIFLLSMCLRGGAFEGMYLAKMMHLAFGALAVAAVYLGLRREQEARSRFAAVLLAASPLAIYLSWMALVELAELCYLALALLWLRQWLRERNVSSAAVIGLMLGGACGVKYLSVGFIVAPVLVVMFVAAIFRLRSLGHVLLAAALTVTLMAPWLVRNYAATGNPVFPLGTTVLGRGYWSAQEQQRWLAGHGPTAQPPVPQPSDWQKRPAPTRMELLYRNFVLSQWFGPLTKLLAALAICVMFASTRKVDPWDVSLAGVLVMQLAFWTATAQGMPERFAAPALVPMALLAGGLLSQLGQVQVNPLRKHAGRPAFGPWGLKPAIIVFLAAVAVNLLVCYGLYVAATGQIQYQGAPGIDVARNVPPWKQASELPPGSRVLLVGDAKLFYYPPGTAYATVFDPQLLDGMIGRGLSAREILEQLRSRGITHLWFDWGEIRRLAQTYGFPASLSAGLVDRANRGLPPGLEIIDRLSALGMTVAGEVRLPVATPASAPTTSSAPASALAVATAPTTLPTTGPGRWPIATIYALPPLPQATSQAQSRP